VRRRGLEIWTDDSCAEARANAVGACGGACTWSGTMAVMMRGEVPTDDDVALEDSSVCGRHGTSFVVLEGNVVVVDTPFEYRQAKPLLPPRRSLCSARAWQEGSCCSPLWRACEAHLVRPDGGRAPGSSGERVRLSRMTRRKVALPHSPIRCHSPFSCQSSHRPSNRHLRTTRDNLCRGRFHTHPPGLLPTA
jgi:hypothetical protein